MICFCTTIGPVANKETRINLLHAPVIVLLGILGAALGSFFNVCIYRIPLGISISKPPSHCPSCKTKIKPWHNIPVLSFLFLGAKCKYCGAKMSWHYLILEILTPLLLVGVFFLYRYTDNTQLLNPFGLNILFAKYAIFVCFGIIIFTIDLFHQIIPHVLSWPLIALGILFSFAPYADVAWQQSLYGAGLGFGLFMIIYLYYYYKIKSQNAKIHKESAPEDTPAIEDDEGMGLGGGDVWLLAAIGAFTGVKGVLFTIFIGSLLGLIYVIASQHERQKHIPFGPYLLAAAFIYTLLGDVVVSWYLSLMAV